MRLILGLLLALALLLSSCGSETPDEQADDPAPAETGASTPTATTTLGNGPADLGHVAVVSESAVGGEVAPQAVDLNDEAALAAFLGQFEDERMATALRQAIAEADVDEGQTLVGAVVAIGCVPPRAVTVDRTDAGLEMAAVRDKNAEHPQVECVVPVTSVGVAAVDGSLV